MKADYKNWVPKYMVNGLITGTIVFAVLFVIFGVIGLGLSGVLRWIIFAALLIALIGIGMFLKWSVMAYKAFSYDGTRQLSKQIIRINCHITAESCYVHFTGPNKVIVSTY